MVKKNESKSVRQLTLLLQAPDAGNLAATANVRDDEGVAGPSSLHFSPPADLICLLYCCSSNKEVIRFCYIIIIIIRIYMMQSGGQYRRELSFCKSKQSYNIIIYTHSKQTHQANKLRNAFMIEVGNALCTAAFIIFIYKYIIAEGLCKEKEKKKIYIPTSAQTIRLPLYYKI